MGSCRRLTTHSVCGGRDDEAVRNATFGLSEAGFVVTVQKFNGLKKLDLIEFDFFTEF
jgi:hypothetical protein